MRHYNVPEEAQMKLNCPVCGKPRSEDSQFCRFCGLQLTESFPGPAYSRREPEVSHREEGRRSSGAGLTVGILLIVAAIVIVYLLRPHGAQVTFTIR